jgi:hypothetical protein
MSEQPERPAQPGAETHVAKDSVAGVQAALDATFNAVHASGGGDPRPDRQDVERELRRRLEEHGAAGAVGEEWVADAAALIAAGEPVAAEPGDA